MGRLLVLALCAWLCQGCFVFDELDKGRDILEVHGGKPGAPKYDRNAAPAAEPAPGPAEEPGRIEALFARARAWWQEEREDGPPERPADDVVVRCKVDGSTHFTHKSECLVRGGSIL
jgi:hypothetical protein